MKTVKLELGGRWKCSRREQHHGQAERCYAKGQFWLDRFNLLSGRGDRAAPKV